LLAKDRFTGGTQYIPSDADAKFLLCHVLPLSVLPSYFRLHGAAESTIDRPDMPIHVRSFVGGQNDSGWSDFLQFAPATRGRAFAHPIVELLVLDQTSVHLGSEEPRCNCVRRDVVRREFDG